MAVARTENTSRSSGTTFQSPASTTGAHRQEARCMTAEAVHPPQLVFEFFGSTDCR